MRVITVRNVCQALPAGIDLLMREGVREESRAGPVLVMPCPVTTAYTHPMERVLLSPVRDANPFFHLFEALWMLAGREDGEFLDRFIKDFSARFAEQPGGYIHGAYGARWITHFDWPDIYEVEDFTCMNQLRVLARLLRRDPGTRQAVLTMWDPTEDLSAAPLKDRPCNTHIYFRINGGALDMTVLCRSNDIIWGAYGANAVHMSVLQEYMAAMARVRVGTYYQVSNNYHAYVSEIGRLTERCAVAPGVGLSQQLDDDRYGAQPGGDLLLTSMPMVTHPEAFNNDLRRFMEWTESKIDQTFHNSWFILVAVPMLTAHDYWRQGDFKTALAAAGNIEAPDWRVAAQEWIERRRK